MANQPKQNIINESEISETKMIKQRTIPMAWGARELEMEGGKRIPKEVVPTKWLWPLWMGVVSKKDIGFWFCREEDNRVFYSLQQNTKREWPTTICPSPHFDVLSSFVHTYIYYPLFYFLAFWAFSASSCDCHYHQYQKNRSQC